MSKRIELTELQGLACELGYELIYMVDGSETEFAKIDLATWEDWLREHWIEKKRIGLSRDGELFITPIPIKELKRCLIRAVARKCRLRNLNLHNEKIAEYEACPECKSKLWRRLEEKGKTALCMECGHVYEIGSVEKAGASNGQA